VSRLRRAGVALLAGGTTALVALSFVPVVALATPIEPSLDRLGAVAVVVGLVVAADGARQPATRLVVVRSAALVAGCAVLGGLGLGAVVWTRAPAAGDGGLLRYAPLVPVAGGLVVGALVGGFGLSYWRRTAPPGRG
jgi:hypothetical protein